MTETRPADPVESLVLDLLEWIGPDARPYDEALEAWRTSCPRLPVWEEADAAGFLSRELRDDRLMLRVSARGRTHLAACRRPMAPGFVIDLAHANSPTVSCDRCGLSRSVAGRG
jgi:hypothetical protein